MSFADALSRARRPSPLRAAAIRGGLALAGLAALGALAAPTGFTGQLLKMLAALAAASALAYFALQALAARPRATSEPALRVVCRAPLSARNQLAIVEADGRRYLLAYGDAFVQLLDADPHELAIPVHPPEELQ